MSVLYRAIRDTHLLKLGGSAFILRACLLSFKIELPACKKFVCSLSNSSFQRAKSLTGSKQSRSALPWILQGSTPVKFQLCVIIVHTTVSLYLSVCFVKVGCRVQSESCVSVCFVKVGCRVKSENCGCSFDISKGFRNTMMLAHFRSTYGAETFRIYS